MDRIKRLRSTGNLHHFEPLYVFIYHSTICKHDTNCSKRLCAMSPWNWCNSYDHDHDNQDYSGDYYYD